MNKTVHKYTLEYMDNFIVELREGAEVIYFAVQHGQPRMWALVDTDAVVEPVSFAFVGTGHPMPRIREGLRWKHVGSTMERDGQLVWHLFRAVLDS